MENKIKYGLKNCYYALAAFDEEGNVTYDTPVALPGARSLSLDHEGDLENFYADDSVYVVLSSNTGYTGSLEVALLPERFFQDIMKEEVDDKGVMLENSDTEPAHFALLFELNGDVHKTRHVFYNCTCSRPSIESATTENSKEPKTDTLDLTAAPLVNGYVKGKTTADVDTATYDSWFQEVHLPSVSASG